MIPTRCLAALLCLSACGLADTAALREIDALSTLTVDPADIALRVMLPDAVAIRPGTARLSLSATTPAGQGVAQDVRLRRSGDVYDIAPEDRAALAEVQARIAKLKADVPETEGTLAISATLCRRGSGGGGADVALRLDRDGPFRPLLTGVPLAVIARATPIGPCI